MIQGPRRTTLQRGRSGPAGVIGPAPKTAAPPRTARFQAMSKAKQARDRLTMAKLNRGRKRSAGALKRPSKREIYDERYGNGNGNGNGNGAMTWWSNPWIWAGGVAFVWILQKQRKQGARKSAAIENAFRRGERAGRS